MTISYFRKMKERYKIFLIQMLIASATSKEIDSETPDKNPTIQSKDGKILVFDVVTFPNDPCFSASLDRVSALFKFYFLGIQAKWLQGLSASKIRNATRILKPSGLLFFTKIMWLKGFFPQSQRIWLILAKIK